MKTKEEIYFKKKKCILNKLFINCIKLEKGEAKRIIKNGKDLSIKDFGPLKPSKELILYLVGILYP